MNNRKYKEHMKKITILFSLLLLFSGAMPAQEIGKCGMTKAVEKRMAADKEFAKKVEQSKELRAKLNGFQTPNSTVYTIPVVFFILHENGNENVSNAQIEDAVRILNVDYRKLNPDTVDIVPEFKQLAADIEIEFRLATIDPDGNCTNGIIRHQTSATDFDGSYAYTGVGPGLWDPQKYLCFYICRSLDVPGAAAYTYIPGWMGPGSPADAVVSLHNYVGSIGTSTPFTSRVLTHEVGHWLGLDHVWGGTNSPGVACGDDGVSDTPITMGFSGCALSNAQICTPGVTENVQNYMEYSYCDRMFTIGQKNLMRGVIATGANAGRDNLVSAANLLATGVTNPIVCAPVADFITVNNRFNYCTGQQIQLRDNTLNAHPTGWSWSFPGGTPAASTDSMPYVSYNTPGTYAISYTATNTAGSSSITKTAYITVVSNTAAYNTAFYEGFESAAIPGTDWTTDASMDGNTWISTNVAAATGSNSAMINNFNNTASDVEVLYSPSYNLSAINAASSPVAFTFKLAHQRASSSAAEKLSVYSSTNCGQSWIQRYVKNGSALATVTGINTSPYVPAASTDWRTETVAVTALSGQTNVFFKFVFTSDIGGNGNNIYIDDINIAGAPVGLAELKGAGKLEVYPNPSNGAATIAFHLEEKSTVELKVSDVLGKTIQVLAAKELSAGEQQFTFDTSSLTKGVYLITCTVNGITTNRKLLVD
jgi:PKD repeat protein